mgnify:CR=1 FL=1
MNALRELLILMRAAQTRLSVDWCHWRLERARHELADAHDAHDKACAAVRLHYAPPPEPEVPAFLLVGNVQPIKRKKA